MSEKLTYEHLLAASQPGAASALSIHTQLVPAHGELASIAPARYLTDKNLPTYLFQKRYLDGQSVDTVVIDSKQSSINRIEAAMSMAMRDEHGPLSLTPRIDVHYEKPNLHVFDIDLPHRLVDAHIRASHDEAGNATGTIKRWVEARDAGRTKNYLPVLELSPASLLFGIWDSHRAMNQLRLASILSGETIGVLSHQGDPRSAQNRQGNARVDPVSASVSFNDKNMTKEIIDDLSLNEGMSVKKQTDLRKKASIKGSELGFGALPPSLDNLGGVSCSTITRSHVFSFNRLRELRFGQDAPGNEILRALLAAWGLCGLVLSYEEMTYRANCELVEANSPQAILHGRGGQSLNLDLPMLEDMETILFRAIEEAKPYITWDNDNPLNLIGNPSVIDGASAEEE